MPPRRSENRDSRRRTSSTPTAEPSEPVAWMIVYGCGCEIPCTTKVVGTFCPKHDEDGPVVETRELVYAHRVPEDQ